MKKKVIFPFLLFVFSSVISQAKVCGCVDGWFFSTTRYSYAVSGNNCCAPQAGVALAEEVSAGYYGGYDYYAEYVSINEAQSACC